MPAFDPTVLKSYDIRGTHPEQLDERFAYRLGLALPQVLAVKSVAIGRDCRLSSPLLYAALAAGVRDAGARVGCMGLCPTELVYFVTGMDYGFDLGVMVTASHNPPRYNGFKVVRAGGEPVVGTGALREALGLMQRMEAEPPASLPEPAQTVDAAAEYSRFALELVGRPDAGGLRVVVDAGNGVGGLLWESLADSIGLEPIGMNMEPDGRFPAHHPDPSKRETLDLLVARVQAEGADAGFAYDGDADRVVVVMRDGHVVDGSEMTACIVHRLLARDPGCVFGVGQTTSRKVLDYFAARGVEPVITPVGHAKIKRVLRARPEMAFAGEDAGHYYFRDFFRCDSALVTTLHLLHLLAGGELGRLVGSFSGPWHRPAREPAIAFADQGHALSVCRWVAERALDEWPGASEVSCEVAGEVLRHCGRDEIASSDGVRVDYADWWFCVRPSGTEPIARLALEARTSGLLDGRMGRLLAMFEELKGAG